MDEKAKHHCAWGTVAAGAARIPRASIVPLVTLARGSETVADCDTGSWLLAGFKYHDLWELYGVQSINGNVSVVRQPRIRGSHADVSRRAWTVS